MSTTEFISAADQLIEEGIAIGKAEERVIAKAETVLTFLRAKFSRVSKETEKAIRQMTDPVALDSLAAHVIHSETLDEFAEALK